MTHHYHTKTLTHRLLLTIAMCLAVLASARANLTLIDTIDIGSQSTENILAATSTAFGEPDLTDLLRVEEGAFAPADSPFTIEYLQGNVAQVSWDLTDSGFNLLGIYVFGGNRGANLYQVTDAEQMISGTALINAPLAGNSGQFAGISHTLFLGAPNGAIPEPSTVALMVSALGALMGAQRLIRRRL